MELIYNIIDILLPFQWTAHIFMKNALIAIMIVTPIFGILGTMIVNNRMAFFSDALGHSALTGIAIGVVLGFGNPIWSMIAFAVFFSLALITVRNSNTTSTDTIIGVFSSTAIALGIVILSRGGDFNKFSSYLIGDLLSITINDIVMLISVLVIVLIFWATMFNKIMIISINKPLAKSRGINTRIVEIIFTAIIAIIVMISIQWVGLLIINSLLVLPAAAARNVSKNMREYHVFSVSIAVISGFCGLILSYYWNTATGATIVLISAVAFLVTYAMRNRVV